MRTRIPRVLGGLLLGGLLLASTGCAGNVAHWIVQTRDHQGDVSVAHQNFPDASVAYQLALKIDPQDAHAKAGLVTVQVRIAENAFTASKFEEAVEALRIANQNAPGDDRIDALRTRIEQAMVKRDIVVSNYPSYAETGASIRRQVLALSKDIAKLATTLGRFDYNFDSNELTQAIRDSYGSSDELKRVTNRLISFRTLVDSGTPSRSDAGQSGQPSSLLPLP